MNLAVHGLEGDIRQATIYYDDPHELLGRADYVMANPPFNVDEIDANRVRTDPRLPFGLPGVNKKQKVGNGNNFNESHRKASCDAPSGAHDPRQAAQRQAEVPLDAYRVAGPGRSCG